jgi:hypothetical protein
MSKIDFDTKFEELVSAAYDFAYIEYDHYTKAKAARTKKNRDKVIRAAFDLVTAVVNEQAEEREANNAETR